MCFTMFLIDFHDLHHVITQHRFMMYHPHHFVNISWLIINNLWYVIVIYHLYMIMMHHLHFFVYFWNMSSLIFNHLCYVIVIYHLDMIMIHNLHHFRNMYLKHFRIFYHHLSSSCDCHVSSSSFSQHVITYLKHLQQIRILNNFNSSQFRFCFW